MLCTWNLEVDVEFVDLNILPMSQCYFFDNVKLLPWSSVSLLLTQDEALHGLLQEIQEDPTPRTWKFVWVYLDDWTICLEFLEILLKLIKASINTVFIERSVPVSMSVIGKWCLKHYSHNRMTISAVQQKCLHLKTCNGNKVLLRTWKNKSGEVHSQNFDLLLNNLKTII